MATKEIKLTTDIGVKVGTGSYTGGTISIDILPNYRQWKGPHQLPEPGQLVLVTRNKNLDPKFNGAVKVNTPISIEVAPSIAPGGPYAPSNLFSGFITDATVRYGRKAEDTIITITATDHFGLLKRHNFTENFAQTFLQNPGFAGWDLKTLLSNIYNSGEITNFNFFELTESNQGLYPEPFNPPSRSAIKAGDSAWDVISRLAVSQLNSLWCSPIYNGIMLKRYHKYDPNHWFENYSLTGNPGNYINTTDKLYYEETDSDTRFFSTVAGKSYRNLTLNDGVHNILNQITFSNKNSTYSHTSDSIVESESTKDTIENLNLVDEFSGASETIYTAFNNQLDVQATYDQLAYDIFEDRSFYGMEIETMEVDGRENYLNIILEHNIYGTVTISVNHSVPGYGSIFRVYEVIGIEHKITRDDWNAKFYLKLHDQYKSHAKIATSPEMIMTAASSGVGNTNTNFSARLQNYSFVDAKQVLWSYEAQQLKGDVVSFGWSPYYLDFITATSAVSAITNPAQTISKTWNYDASTSKVFLDYWGDEPYLVQQDPTYTPDRWDFAGDKAIIAYTQLDDYWWRKSEPCIGQDCNNYLKVSAAIPTANFTYTNNNGTVTFNNASFDNDTNLWNFGVTPAATSNATNPVYTYAASGTYSVTLTVDNGVATSSITKNVFVPIARVPWRLMRFDISGTRDFINGVWTKYLPGGMMQVQSNHNSTNTLLQQNSAYPGKGDTTSTTGKIILTRDFTSPYLFDPWDATTSDSTRNISVFTGTNQNVAAAYNNGIEFIAATSMPSGNLRETIDVKIYFIIPPEATQSQRTTVAGLVGFFTSYRNSAGSLVNGVPVPSRVLFQPNQTHEKIKVFVSDYNTQDMAVAKGALPTWYEIGYWQININQTTYDNLFFTRAMTPIVPLPLVYP